MGRSDPACDLHDDPAGFRKKVQDGGGDMPPVLSPGLNEGALTPWSVSRLPA
jgi:hypothetical protein